MAINYNTDKDPNDYEDNGIGNQQGKTDKIKSKLPSKPVSDNTEDNELELIRQSFLKLSNNNQNSLNEDESLNPVTDNGLTSNESDDGDKFNNFLKNLFPDGEPSEKSSAFSSPIFSPFNENDFAESEEYAPANPNNLGNYFDEHNNSLEGGVISNQGSTTPPFVIENDSDNNTKSNSLTDKIRRGLIPAETIQLLITSSMTEDQVTAIVKELGIEWNLIPGNNRTEKINNLIEYFDQKGNNNNEPGSNPSNPDNPNFLSGISEYDWLESEYRLHELQETLVKPKDEIPVEKEETSYSNGLKHDIEQFGPIFKKIVLGLGLLASLLIFGILYYVFFNNPSPTTSTVIRVTNEFPYPIKIQFPTELNFVLEIGQLQDLQGNPKSAEWLQGTEICRIIVIPWTTQVEEAFYRFTIGDVINLNMSNQDKLTFKIETVKKIKLSEIDPIINRTSPCLVVLLTNENPDDNLILIATPEFIQP